MEQKTTVQTLLKMKKAGKRIAMMTAYDYPTARLLDEAGLHVLLVGDSLGMVVQGHTTTVTVTLDDIVYHTKMVSRGAQRALVVADMPFLTAHLSETEVIRAAGRLMQDGGAHAVKIEGGSHLAPVVNRLVEAGIPVMGHLGLMPQSVHAIGGFTVQGRTRESAQRMLADAIALQEAGAFAVVLEMVPAEVAGYITKRLRIPTIGIGAGPQCDGQVLVFHDMAGFTDGYIPKHNKRYANLAETILSAARSYVEEVTSGAFPGEAQTVHLKPEEWKDLEPLFADHTLETKRR
ncbi:3-methyl-2-oxobutanoate hydroxymethyltransferase [Alicyclobacillus macrosporangiidus]|uniref:3-methyl-2-oxobutanoate hydroxymethyltransferase n=1 Tax=Alicyclobacillus macrosporangiidus TaxID=392015 RepID=A0A1I7L9T0_9BACL|nr:3-methyl-2-oxobutanoate hydroxymethyltransferase [Alicyclobacillus macrosporangiidus]SFV06296.1 3-methyl-2-oxobutanoate hydroxymethyltransferase [Alicyclobacillus macrosporangiidus]